MGEESTRPRDLVAGPPAVLSWSSGKDAAYALHKVRQERTFNVVALLTAVVSPSGRVATHGVRGDLLTAQAAETGLPLIRVELPPSPSNVVYEKAMAHALRRFRTQGIRHIVFGDLFLDDIRRYRERQLAKLDLECVFPLWGRDTLGLAREIVAAGLRARFVAVDTGKIPAEWAGRPFDRKWLSEVPPEVDPCGENGEFHSFVTGGPMFRRSIPVRIDGRGVRNGMATVDLVSRSGPAPTHVSPS